MKKIVSAIFTVIVFLGCVQLLNFHADAAIDVASKISASRSVYVNGQYFCYLNSSDCSKSGTKHCSHSWGSSCSNCGAYIYDGTEKAWQCHGFACRMGYVVFGKDPYSTWTKLYSVSTLKAGDIVRYRPTSTATYNHSIFIISVSGSTVKYVDCNATGTYACQIRWDASTTTSTLATNISRKLYNSNLYGYVWRAPNNTATSSSSGVASEYSKTVNNGIYTFKSAHSSGKMLNVYGGTNANGTKVTTWSQDGTDDQQFYVKYVSDGKYLIYAVCSSNGSGYDRVVDLNVGSNNVIDLGDSFDIWARSSSWDSSQYFYIVPVEDDKYVFELASTPNAVLACKNADNAATNGGEITLRNYEDITTEQWYFYNASGTTKVDPSVDATNVSTTYYTGTYKVSATDGLNVRSGAGTSYTKLDTLTYETTVTVTQVSGSWGKITYDDTTGWICLDYTSYISPLLSSISVKTGPSRTSYYVGDTLNTSGLTLTASYSNNTTGTISSGFTCSPTTLSTAGNQTITVSYSGKSTTFTVTVTAVAVSSISVKTNPTKTSYFSGDTLSTAGLTLTATYNNSTTATVSSGFTCSPTTLSTAGTQPITVTYGGKTTTFNVTVNPVVINSITVKTNPTKTSYYVGDMLNTSGLTLTATYNNGTTATVSSGFTCSPTTLSTAGNQTITVSYSGQSTTFTVTVTSGTVNVTGVTLSSSTLSMTVNQTAQLTSNINPNNATNKAVTWSSSNNNIATVVNGLVTAKAAGNATITVTTSDGGKTATCVVTVTSSSVSVTGVTLSSSTLSMAINQTAQLTATVNPSNATNKAVTWSTSNSNVASVVNGLVTAKTAGNATITVTTADGGKTATCVVTVSDDTLSSISLRTMPSKTSYYVGQALDTTGLTLTATFSNNTWMVVGNDYITCTPMTLTTLGTQQIAASYGGKTVYFDVTVLQVTLSYIEINTSPSAISYTVGDMLDTTGMTLTLHYSDNSTTTVNNGFTCSPTVLSSAGVQEITVTYLGKTASFNVYVSEEEENGFYVYDEDGETPINDTDIDFNFKDETSLIAYFYNESDGLTITWTSDSPDVVSVDENGNITTTGTGTAVITATIAGTDITAQFTINVSYTWWQWLLLIFLFGWIWY